VLTWRPALALAIGAVPMLAIREPAWALVPIVVTALLVAFDVSVAASPADVRLTRDGDRQVRLGGTARVTLAVTNEGLRELRATVRDAWVPSAGAPDETSRILLAPGETARLDTVLEPTRRGDRPAARVTIRSYGPLGFGYRQNTVRQARSTTPAWTLRVLPRFDSRRFLAEKLAKLRIFDGSIVMRGRGEGTEFDTLREYVLGDDVRSIDWRASARRHDVMVRTWRPERDRHVVCVIDTGRTSAVRVGTTSPDLRLDEPRLDAAIDAALLLAEVANRAGDSVSLIAADTAVRASVSGGANKTLLPKLVAALAPLQPTLVETDFGMIVGEVLRRERKRALVVLFTALEPGALGESLLPVLNQLTARHTVLVASVHDPSLAEMAVERGSAESVFRAAAAHHALAERRRVVSALRRRDVFVVDSAVSLYASAVCDGYLGLKAAGRL
jgi:uncharacterized protein (DUF58 family)